MLNRDTLFTPGSVAFEPVELGNERSRGFVIQGRVGLILNRAFCQSETVAAAWG
jgi:hypothetical protein